jgi:methyl-accepting chemotaxis protein
VSGILSDPKIIEATNGLIAILLAGLGGVVAMWFAHLKASMESHMQRVAKAAEEARKAAQSADAQVSNDHTTNFRDDLDEVRDAVKAVNETVGALTILPEKFEGLSSMVDSVASTLETHGASLSDMRERIDRIDERGSRMAAEIHDERTARESAQRMIDSHAHDTHRAIYERIEALESRINA